MEGDMKLIFRLRLMESGGVSCFRADVEENIEDQTSKYQ